MNPPKLLTTAAALLALSGCALPSLSPDVYPRSEAGRVHSNQYGEIVMLREVPIAGRSSVIGTYGGGYIGASAGGAIGDGTGEVIAQAVGAVAGAVAGEKVEEISTRSDGLEITVQLDSGKIITIVQSAEVAFAEGERVRILMSSNSRGRILKY